MIDGHGTIKAGVACRDGTTRQRDVEWEVVEIDVGPGGLVGDGTGEAVLRGIRVLQAACAVQRLICQHGHVCLHNDRVTQLIVDAAVGGVRQVLGQRSHVGGAEVDVGRTGGVEHLGDTDKGLFCLEEGLRALTSGARGQ